MLSTGIRTPSVSGVRGPIWRALSARRRVEPGGAETVPETRSAYAGTRITGGYYLTLLPDRRCAGALWCFYQYRAAGHPSGTGGDDRQYRRRT